MADGDPAFNVDVPRRSGFSSDRAHTVLTFIGVDFFDGWEDGDFTSDPSWTEYVVEGDGEATVEDRDSPDGGSKVLRVHEATAGGTTYIIGWTESTSGWETTWTLSGLFFTTNFDPDGTFETHSLDIIRDTTSTGEKDIRVDLGMRDGDGNIVPFRIRGNAITSVDTTDDMGGWEENAWFHYEINYDGDGNYEGFAWKDGDGKPDSPNATSSGNDPPSDLFGTIFINGEDTAFDMDHAFMQWEK